MSIEYNIIGSLSPFLEHWGYLILFLASLLESLPAVGSIVPGHALVMLGGFLARMGTLDFGDVIILTTIGAVIGDFISYLLGRNYGYPFIIRHSKKLFLKMKYFDKARALFDANAGKAIVIGRLNFVTRSFMALVAGASGVKYFKFIFYDVISCFIWAGVAVLAGYIFGQSYELVAGYVGRYFFFATVVGLIIALVYYYLHKTKQAFLTRHFRFLVLNIFSLYVFAKMVEDVFAKEPLFSFDYWLNNKIVLLWQPGLNELMILITNIFTPLNLFILSLVILGLLFYRKKWYFFLLYLTSLGGGLLISDILKSIIERPRPTDSMIYAAGYSFPSEHALIATIFFSLLYYSFRKDIKDILLRDLFLLSCIFLFLLVGFSRIYLRVHWFSDVAAGFSLGLFWLTLLILIFRLIIHLYKDRLAVIEQKINQTISSKV